MAAARYTIISCSKGSQMTNRRTWLFLAPLLGVALALLFVAPAHAHDGAGNELHGPLAPWIIGLVYLQLLLIPIVGIWLTGEAVAAWRPRRQLPEGL